MSGALADRLERRWFAAFKAASVARAECEALLDQMTAIDAAWRLARARLADIEVIRDALGDELALMQGSHALETACASGAQAGAA